jgi:glycosyltransferase involved in cell wall biosynthesis
VPESPEPIQLEELRGAKRVLRVAVVTETYPPEINGVALTAARFLQGLRRRGHEIQLVRPRQDAGAPATGAAFQEVLTRGMPIPRYPNLRMGLPARRALQQRWSYHRPDVVHIVTEGPLGWSALRAALKLRLPVVSDFRTNFHSYSGHYGVGWLRKPILAYLRRFHNRTLFTLVPTEALRQELAALGFGGLRVVARGVDTALFDPARRSDALRARWGAAPADPVLLYVGRLAPEKNPAALLAAFEAARRRAPRARLVLVGDGPAQRELQARCPDAAFAGTRRGEDLAAHYASGDVFLFPSLTETYGNVVLEAMSSGLAVVAYDCAAASAHIRHGRSGLLAPVGDGEAFSALAADAASEGERLRALGAQARTHALEHSWDNVVLQLESILGIAAELSAESVSAGRYGSSGARRTRTPMPQRAYPDTA